MSRNVETIPEKKAALLQTNTFHRDPTQTQVLDREMARLIRKSVIGSDIHIEVNEFNSLWIVF